VKPVHALTHFGLGAVFGTGLVVSGLTKPSVILGALDFGGVWNPSMFVVVLVSVAIYAPTRRRILRRSKPVSGNSFPRTPSDPIDARLITGAAIFGLGWGLCGSCPGQSITAFLGSPNTMLFVGSLLGGMGLFRAFDALTTKARQSGRPDTVPPRRTHARCPR
jgi:uncharacterized membrane protein YedE/YeeE